MLPQPMDTAPSTSPLAVVEEPAVQQRMGPGETVDHGKPRRGGTVGGGPWWGGRAVLEQCAPSGLAPVVGICVGAFSSESQPAGVHAGSVPEGLRAVGGTPRRTSAETERRGDRDQAFRAYSSPRAAFGVVEGSGWGRVFLVCFYFSQL